ncbi:hypothetical protein EG856_00835 [Mycoplasmopsis phocirhinis]|uniref:Deoxynucleoside kinase domain-containing protein n=1 Tax=Mycoplasmopsis phocirhinis TaxID=142650 RepID=A0A4P6MLJ5_9BACT|nr:hypothetical protein [Mycoplasmopsis phocirhinis]QBF34475.1 hypothetical protein EG856_00835 [Mycoplasmopsis phocirhinis]
MAKFLAISINAFLIISFIMMILGFEESWLMWQFKNLCSIIFFAGVGTTNISVIVMNICFSILSLYIYVKVRKNKKILIAITGPGCVGKSVVLNSQEVQDLLNRYEFKLMDEREYLNENDELNKNNDYLNALKNKNNFFKSQKLFFTNQAKFIEEAQLIESNVFFDRYMSDSFLYGDVLYRENIFNQDEKNKWYKLRKRYKYFLSVKPKLDLLIIFTAPLEKINEWRLKSSVKDIRRKLEQDNFDLYQKYYQEYFTDSDWKNIAKKSAKKIVWINNNSDIDTVKTKLIKEIKSVLEVKK